MVKKKQKRRWKIGISFLICGILFYLAYSWEEKIPDSIYLSAGKQNEINLRLPFHASIETECKEVMVSDDSHIPSKEVNMAVNRPFLIYTPQIGNYELSLKLFGIWNIKEIKVNAVEPEYLLPAGFPVGIYLQSDGLFVIGTSKLNDCQGITSEPAKEIVKTGDYIVKINGNKILNKESFMRMLNENGMQDVKLTIRRGEEELDVKIRPVNTAPGEYKLGLWVRDDTQGIGTLTYIDRNNRFGALGHGISDSDTGLLMEAEKGNLYETNIYTIIKGTSGNPGSLSGTICYGRDHEYGSIRANTVQGIFGVANEALKEQVQGEWILAGYKQDVHKGEAYIRSNVDGVTKDYKIEILEVNTSSHNNNKGIVLQVTDEELLRKTGGIVQGMSGSPIIQDGKLIGAVTHVFIQDSTKGYGIFLEEMKQMDAGV